MNELMVCDDIVQFSTAELVAELSKRGGVLQLHPDDAVRDLNEIL